MTDKNNRYVCTVCNGIWGRKKIWEKHVNQCYTRHRNSLIPLACKLAYGKYDSHRAKPVNPQWRESRMYAYYMQQLAYEERYSHFTYQCPYNSYEEYISDDRE